MESSDQTTLVTCELYPAVMPKEEILQYLTVDSEIFRQWRNFGESHSLSTDSNVAAFLLQHYQKTSGLVLTQCVKCSGSLTQYCIKCNIYVGQPSNANPPLRLDAASLSAGQGDRVGNTIIVDMTNATQSPSPPKDRQIITIKVAGGADNLTKVGKGGPLSAERLKAVVEAYTMAQKMSSSKPLPPTGSHTHRWVPVKAQSMSTPQSSLTSSSQSPAKSQLASMSTSAAGRKTSDDRTHLSPSRSSLIKVVGENESSPSCVCDERNKAVLPSNSTGDSDNDATLFTSDIDEDFNEMNTNRNSTGTRSGDGDKKKEAAKEQNDSHPKSQVSGQVSIIRGEADFENEGELPEPEKQSVQLCEEQRESPSTENVAVLDILDFAEEEKSQSSRKRKRKKGEPDDDDEEFRKVVSTEKVKQKYQCEQCSQVLRSKYELECHLRIHKGERPYACTHCPATYVRPHCLKAHVITHVKSYNCPDCSKVFSLKRKLKAHSHVHSNEKPFICEICGLGTKAMANLKHHKRVHEDAPRPFMCQVCGKSFRWKSNLKDHIKLHNNEKPHACTQCNNKYAQASTLRRHMNTTHNPNRKRSFVCVICNAARYDKVQLEKHMMIHKKIKPYKCDVCGAAFIQSSALTGHMKIHTETEGKKHWCNICGAGFKQFASIKIHYKKVHADSNDISVREEVVM